MSSLFQGIFVSKPRRKAPPKPTHGDPDASLFTLALRTVVASCDEATCDADLEELREMVAALATWPPNALEFILPLVNVKLLLACRDAGLQPGEERHRGLSRATGSEDDTASGEAHLRRLATPRVLDRAIRREELLYRQWRGSGPRDALPPPPSAVVAAFSLVDVFGEWGTWLNASEPPAMPRAQLLFSHERDARLPRPGAPVFEQSLDAFEDNWDAFTRGSLTGLNWRGIVAAGGAVTACVLRGRAAELAARVPTSLDECDEARWRWFEPAQHAQFRRRTASGYSNQTDATWHSDPLSSPFATSSDVDLFLAALEAVRRVHRTLKRNARGPVLVVRTGSALTFVAGGFPTRFVQVVLKLFPSAADVLTAFDVDVCGFAYDGQRVLATQRALRAAATQTNLIDLERRSMTYESRLLKYARRGFAIGADASLLDRARLDPRLFDARTVLQRGEARERVYQQGLARLLTAERFALAPELLPLHYTHNTTSDNYYQYHRGAASIDEPGPVSFFDAWANGFFGPGVGGGHGTDWATRFAMLPLPTTRPSHRLFRGSRESNEVEAFHNIEADDAESAHAARAAAAGTAQMHPVLYSAGVLPWKLGYDCRTIEALLRDARREGDGFDEWRRLEREDGQHGQNGGAAAKPSIES